jgi:hypothetical protein
MLEDIRSRRVGWRPVGWMKVQLNCSEKGWCRAGNEKSVGEGLVSSPTTVRNPPRESCSGSCGGETERIPTSRRDEGSCFEICIPWSLEGKKAVKTRAWEIVSKSRSRVDACDRADTREMHSGSFDRQSRCLIYSVRLSRDLRGE